ncbi:unnamed protein product, partial [Laminaria digitata]
GVGKRLGGGNGQAGGGRDGGGGGGGGSSGGGSESDHGPALTGLRPEAALELLWGSVVRTGGVAHLLATPTDVSCRGVTLLCRRGPEFAIPAVAPLGGGSSCSSAKVKDKSGSGRPRKNANAARIKKRGDGGGESGVTAAGEQQRQGARGTAGGG